MREAGAKRIATPDGFVLELFDPPLIASSPVGSGVQVPPTGKPDPAGDDDDDIEDDAAIERDLRARWDEHWERIVLSSGAPIPDFPGVDRANEFLRRSRRR